MSSSYRNSLNQWLSELDVKGNKVIDIGGSQEPVKNRINSWDVKEYFIADLPTPHVDSPLPDIEMDLNKIYFVGGFQEEYHLEQYDMVFCLEVFDYVYNPFQAFENIALLLKKGGTAWVSFPSVYPLHQPVEDDALRYFPAGIKKLAESVGLQVVQMIPRRPETNKLTEFYAAERLRAAKGHDHNFLGWIVEFKR